VKGINKDAPYQNH